MLIIMVRCEIVYFLLIKITSYQLLGGFVSLLLKLHISFPFIGVHYAFFYDIGKPQQVTTTTTFPERNGDPNNLAIC